MNDSSSKIDDCWNRIGIWSNAAERCPKLDEVLHCQNCDVYSRAGRALLDRPSPDDYLQEWTRNLGEAKSEKLEQEQSCIVFRIGNESFGLPTDLFKEVTAIGHIHSIPHRRNPVLRGLINIRGELHLCVALGYLFNLEKGEPELSHGRKVHERMMVVEKAGQRFAFPVSEIHQIHHFHPDEVQQPPSTVGNSSSTYLEGVLELSQWNIGLLDPDRLFKALEQSVT